MAHEIIVEGSAQEIARKIAGFPGQIVRAILVVEEKGGDMAASSSRTKPEIGNGTGPKEDEWTKDFRQWAASHKRVQFPVDDGRDSIYADRLA